MESLTRFGAARQFYAFPRAHWHRIRSTNELERLHGETKRWTAAVGAFPNHASALWLVTAVVLQVTAIWTDRRYLDTSLLRSKEPIEAKAARGYPSITTAGHKDGPPRSRGRPMDPAKRIVTHIPLTELWTNEGRVDALRGEPLGEAEIAALLRDARSTFVVASPGEPLRWVAGRARYDLWKTEVKCRLVGRDATSFSLEDFPGSYCYVAAEWRTDPGLHVIVLEKHH
jgi:hypothetical protein